MKPEDYRIWLENERSAMLKRIADKETADVEKSRQRLLNLGPGWQAITDNYQLEDVT